MDNELLGRYLSGDTLPSENIEILEWIEASADNRKEFMQFRRLFDITIWNAEQAAIANEETEPENPSFFISSTKQWIRAAAVVAFTIGGTLLVQNTLQKPTLANQIVEVPLGQHVNLTLSDGTKVSLNSNSKFQFPSSFENDTRTVVLDGEAFFEVAHNAKKPFHVMTQKCDVRVLGTTFNVLAYDDSDFFETSLLEGSVQVSDLASSQQVVLKPNEKVSIQKGELVPSSIDTENDFLWRKGVYVFKNEPLKQVFKKLAQYYQVKIIVQDENINKLRCTGKFRQKDDIEHVIKVLQKSNDFKYKNNEEENTILIY